MTQLDWTIGYSHLMQTVVLLLRTLQPRIALSMIHIDDT